MTEDRIRQYPLIDLSTPSGTVVLGNGDYPTHPIPLRLLDNASFLCCCDGAAMSQMQPGRRMPDAVVGDGDSLPASLRAALGDRLHIVSEQEDNDQTKATRFCARRGATSIIYIGATGKREDHTLGNISLMVRYMRDLGLDVAMVTDYGWFVPARGRSEFMSFPRQQVSIFNMGAHRMSSEGLRWDAYACEQLWQGTLNEATGTSFVLDADGDYLVYRTFDPK